MTDRKKILFITQGNTDHASSRIRCLQYFPSLERSGYTCTWIPRIPVRKGSFFDRFLVFPFQKRVNRLRIFLGILLMPYHILFIQRIFLPEWLLKTARRRKKKIVFDFDDAIYYSETDKKAGIKTKNMIGQADQVIVSSPVLYKYAATYSNHVEMITSPVIVPPGQIPAYEKPFPIIGWVGSEWTSKYLDLLAGVFHELKKKYAVRFLFVGSKSGILPDIQPEIIPWSSEKEPELLSRIDIGIMPLPDTPFEKGKGGYKLFQYMAAGKPVVASPVGINTLIVKEGVNGFLCRDTGEWYQALEKLLQDARLREQMGNAGYRLAKESYGLEVCFQRLMNVLDKMTNR